MPGDVHEIRDPIHVFVRLDSDERRVLDSAPFQRLRHIHQLALTYLVYPGATHKRFEHSLGVMELADRVFAIVTHPNNLTDKIRDLLTPLRSSKQLSYWRQVLRMAALCHDVGHLPFSHASEGLLPNGWDHEAITRRIICSEEMRAVWDSITPPLRHEHIEKLAVGPKKASDLTFSDWEAILSEIIVGDAFGVDRMDYLLRDSYHAGVAYGRFDHYRLVDTLRILPSSQSDEREDSQEPSLGVKMGGIQSAEAMMLARYQMYSQVYFHPVRRIYDIHLTDFLRDWLDKGVSSADLQSYLEMSDVEVTAALRRAMLDQGALSRHANRIMRRGHYRRLYAANPEDRKINPEAGEAIFEALGTHFDPDDFRHDRYTQKGGAPDFPVLIDDRTTLSSLAVSSVLTHLPIISVDYVFVERSVEDKARTWLENHRQDVVKSLKERVSMGRMKNAALVTKLVEQLRDQESWCGETHVQKTVYFLQYLMAVPLGFDFILYKHGPFSFELRDELTALRADDLLTLEHDTRYSPRISATMQSKYIQERFPRTLARYDSRIYFIARRLGPKGVVQLERLGTALYVKFESDEPAAQRVRRITDLKPHIAEKDAIRAVHEVDEIMADSRDVM